MQTKLDVAKNFSLRAKLLSYYLVFIIIPLIAIISVSNFFYSRSIDDQANIHLKQMIAQVQSNIDSYILSVDKIITYMESHPTTIEYLKLSSTDLPGRVDVETAMRNVMQLYTGASSDIGGILIAGENDLYASNQMYRIARYTLKDEDWYKQAINAGGRMLLISKPIGRNIRNYQNYSANDIVSMVRAIMDPETGEPLGVICIDLRLAIIESIIKGVTLGKTGYVFIMDSTGSVVYTPINKTVYRIRPEWLEEENASTVRLIDGEQYQLMFSGSANTNWKTVGVFSYGETLAPVIALRNISFVISAITIGFAALASILFSASFTKPISRLRMLMAQAGNGDLDVNFEGGYSGEIGQLGSSFNKMMDNIRNLVEMVYVEQQNKREAELKTLQAQIKPHFLYNTLDTIKWMAQEREAEDIVVVVSALTKLFRIGISRGKEEIPLKEELEHVNSYLCIQKVRYEQKLSYEIMCDEEIKNHKVQKLILQPLVENAIYHGIKQQRVDGMVTISCTRDDSALLLKVADTGVGMSQEQCDALNRLLRLNKRPENQPGYGVFNVNDRIKLSYGAGFGLTFYPNPDGGTIAVIRHPII